MNEVLVVVADARLLDEIAEREFAAGSAPERSPHPSATRHASGAPAGTPRRPPCCASPWASRSSSPRAPMTISTWSTSPAATPRRPGRRATT